MITNEQYRLIRQHDAFKHLKYEEFEDLAKHIRFRKLPKHQILFFAGDVRHKFFLIQSGYIRIEQYDISGSYSYMHFIKQNDFVPYSGIFEDECYHYTAVAMTDVECYYIPRELYELYSARNSKQLTHICKQLSFILRIHELKLRNLVISSAVNRVVQSLGIMLFTLCDKEDQLPFPITLLELAKMSGTTRETVSQVMKDLKYQGIIDYTKKTLTYLNKRFFLKQLDY